MMFTQLPKPAPTSAGIRLLLLLNCTLLTSNSTLTAQAGTDSKPKQGDAKAAVQKLSEWPSLKKKADRQTRALTKQFRKKDEQLHSDARAALIALGAGTAPVLLPMVHDRANGINEHLLAVLDEVCDARHAALLAREMKRPSVSLRRYVLRRLGSFHDAEMAPVLAKSLADKDPEVAFQAALGLLGIGKTDGLDTVLRATRTRWDEVREQIATALPAARSHKLGSQVLDKIRSKRPTDQMAGLRVLRYLLTKPQASLLRSFLEASDFQVKREAINVARVLHGEKPLEKLASFQAINMAKQWLEKL
ncbi:MAG: HEAT repeat domain-containing protein [Planctomycetota bacterium]